MAEMGDSISGILSPDIVLDSTRVSSGVLMGVSKGVDGIKTSFLK